MKSTDKLGFNFGIFMDRTARKGHTLLARLFKQNKIDLTPYQWTILNLIYHDDGKSQVEIAEKSLRNTASVSRILDVMIKKKLIAREVDATDKRSYNIRITKEGKQIWKKATPVVKEFRAIGWVGLNEEDYDHFMRIMNTVSKNLEG